MIILGGVLFGIIAFILINTGFFHKEIKLARMIAIAEYFIDIGIIKNTHIYKIKKYKINYDQRSNIISSIIKGMNNRTKGKYNILSNFYEYKDFKDFYHNFVYLYKLVKKNETLFYMASKYEFDVEIKDDYGYVIMNYSLFEFLSMDESYKTDLLIYMKEWLLKNKQLSAVDYQIIEEIKINNISGVKNKKTNDIERRIYKKSLNVIENKPEKVAEEPLNEEVHDVTIDIIKKYTSIPETEAENFERLFGKLL